MFHAAGNDKELSGLQADVATLGKYNAALDNARSEYDRVSTLVRRNAVSREDVEQRLRDECPDYGRQRLSRASGPAGDDQRS